MYIIVKLGLSKAFALQIEMCIINYLIIHFNLAMYHHICVQIIDLVLNKGYLRTVFNPYPENNICPENVACLLRLLQIYLRLIILL